MTTFDSLRDRSIVITGSGGGIGRALARSAAAQGMRVHGIDVSPSAGQETVALIAEDGHASSFSACDISDTVALKAVFDGIEEATGGIDVLVNNAAVGSHTAPEELSVEEWNRVIGVCLTGSVFAAQFAARSMMGHGRGGSIVNIASIAGLAALGRGNFAYSIAKAGLLGMTRELAVEWASAGIRVNAIAPSQVDTAGFRPLVDNPDVAAGSILSTALRGVPLGRLAQVEDVIPVILFLAGNDASFLTGVTVPVDGGSMALHAGGTVREQPAT